MKDEIVNILRKRKFNRLKLIESESEFSKIEDAVENTIRSRMPLSFVMYWGISAKQESCSADEQAIAFIEKLSKELQSKYQVGAKFELIFCDTHANFNGYSLKNSYISQVIYHFEKTSIDANFHKMSDIAGNTSQDPPPLDSINEIYINIDPSTKKELKNMASKHHLWEADPDEVVKKYIALNRFESLYVERLFKDSIFITYNDANKLRFLFPLGLPVYSMYSLKKGKTIKPWFVNVNNE